MYSLWNGIEGISLYLSGTPFYLSLDKDEHVFCRRLCYHVIGLRVDRVNQICQLFLLNDFMINEVEGDWYAFFYISVSSVSVLSQ